MPSLAEVLRIACHANGLGTSGSSAVLMQRMCNLVKKSAAENPKKPADLRVPKTKTGKHCSGGKCKKPPRQGKKLATQVKKPVKHVTTPTKRVPVKKSKGGGVRLSAAYYFYDVCGGKLSRCRAHMIEEPSGRHRLKEIRLVKGENGKKHPRWVLCE